MTKPVTTTTIEPEASTIDLSWLEPGTEWGIRATPSKRGLTLEDVNLGSYGTAPLLSRNQSFRPRGAAPRVNVFRTGRTLQEKADIWGDNLAGLYEEAVQRQWSSATDIPWETVKPLPDDMERAMCHVCTFLTEVEFIAGDVPGRWVAQTSQDFFEPKLFLMTQIMDEARHTDVFRKRAFANGGGLMGGSKQVSLRTIIEAKDFSEMSAMLHIVGEGFVLTLFRMGEWLAQNEAEKKMYRLAAQDESRHVAFGVLHLKYMLETQPERREEMHAYLDKAEGFAFDSGLTTDPNTSEALALLLGGGKTKLNLGYKKLRGIQKRQVQEYLHRLGVAGLPERRERCIPRFRKILNPPTTVAMGG